VVLWNPWRVQLSQTTVHCTLERLADISEPEHAAAVSAAAVSAVSAVSVAAAAAPAGFSAQTIFFPLYIATFNALWSAFPSLGFGLFEQDVPGHLSLAHPELYSETRTQTARSALRQYRDHSSSSSALNTRALAVVV